MDNDSNHPLGAMCKAVNEKYGPLMRRNEVAALLQTSPESFGNTLRRGVAPNIKYLRRHKLRFGRRVFYSTVVVAEALVLGSHELTRRSLEQDQTGGGDER